jgi:hypothetical protein
MSSRQFGRLDETEKRADWERASAAVNGILEWAGGFA